MPCVYIRCRIERGNDSLEQIKGGGKQALFEKKNKINSKTGRKEDFCTKSYTTPVIIFNILNLD